MPRLFVIGALAIAGVAHGAPAASETTDRSVFHLRISRDMGEVRGTCVLVHREDRGNEVMLYFLTSSRLFKMPGGQRQPAARAVHLLLDEGRTLDVKRQDVFVPGGDLVDVAVFRVETANITLLPRPLVYDPPSAGNVFLVSGYDQNGDRATVAGHVRFESTRFVVGDRDVSGLVGCVGAPAISPEGVFGVVSECAPNRSAVISLLAIARRFIEEYVPRPVMRASPTP